MRNPEFIIDDGVAVLTAVTRSIFCPGCRQLIALENGSTKLIESRVMLVSEGEGLLVRCGGCKQFVQLQKNKKLVVL